MKITLSGGRVVFLNSAAAVLCFLFPDFCQNNKNHSLYHVYQACYLIAVKGLERAHKLSEDSTVGLVCYLTEHFQKPSLTIAGQLAVSVPKLTRFDRRMDMLRQKVLSLDSNHASVCQRDFWS